MTSSSHIPYAVYSTVTDKATVVAFINIRKTTFKKQKISIKLNHVNCMITYSITRIFSPRIFVVRDFSHKSQLDSKKNHRTADVMML